MEILLERNDKMSQVATGILCILGGPRGQGGAEREGWTTTSHSDKLWKAEVDMTIQEVFLNYYYDPQRKYVFTSLVI